MRGSSRVERWHPIPGSSTCRWSTWWCLRRGRVGVGRCGHGAAGPVIRELIASVTSAHHHYYTHCHVDHAYGTWALMADVPTLWPKRFTACFDRYIELPGSLAKYMGQPVEPARS